MDRAEEEETLLGYPTIPKPRKQSWPLPNLRTSATFIVTALFSGLLFYIIVFSVILSKPTLRSSSKEYIFGAEQAPDTIHDTVTVTYTETLPLPTNYDEKPPGLSTDGLIDMSPDELREMISRTKGYYARDWSLGLGWNNMRYIIETAILHADLLNRTLVLPSFVYARACEYHIDVCAKYAPMVNRNDAIGSDEWRDQIPDEQMAWRIPIEVMMDIPHLRTKHNLITLSEYFILQGLDFRQEVSNGRWDRDYYHQGIDHPDLFVIPNHTYDPDEIARVNSWVPEAYVKPNSTTINHATALKCDAALLERSATKQKAVIEWDDAKSGIRHATGLNNDADVEEAVKAAGWIILYTFDGDAGMEFTKTVVRPIRMVARHDKVHGFIQEYSHVTQKVLLLEGEVHLGRKSGSMFFVSPESRDQVSRIILYDLRASDRVVRLANKVIERMNRINDGRSWMAAHMRRGDFTTAGWAMESTIEGHYTRIMNRLSDGRKVLERIQFMVPEPYEVPDVRPNLELFNKKPPLEGDYIYLATDERSQDGLAYIRQHKGILLPDLVTMQDRREFGWPLLYTDVIALVEQQIIGHGSSYFYAHAMSSVAGGIVNLRAGSGADKRTALLD